MNPETWQRAQDLFHTVVAMPAEQRDKFLRDRTDRGTELWELVERLLAEDARLSSQWDTDLAAFTSRQIDAQFLPKGVGPYEFLRWLGRGGMGSVYQARHVETGQIVAIKVLSATDFSIASRERFATEQRLLARLVHPGIARLYGAERLSDGTPCFVMEYVEGEPLTRYCQDQSLHQRMLLFRQVCEAVQHAHEHGVIHRDLKPSNIFVRKDGSVRLLDFGIAKQLDEGDDYAGPTRLQAVPLTLAYAAPEQLAQGSAVGTHTDVYTLGVTLYELLTDRLPVNLTGMTQGSAEQAIRFAEPEKPSKNITSADKLARTDREDLDLLCMTAIHKDPARRYRSAEALIRDLDHWLNREPLEARADTLGYRASKFLERNAKSLAIAASIVAAVLLGSVWFTLRLNEARKSAVAEQYRTARIESFVLSLFNMGDATAAPRRSATALDVINYGRKEAELVRNDPPFQTDLYRTLGALYGQIGDYRQATTLLENALVQEKGVSRESRLARADTLLKLASVKEQDSEFAEAERLAREAIALLAQTPNCPELQVAKAKSVLGFVMVGARRFGVAIPELEAASRIQRRIHADNELAETLVQLAGAHQESGNYPEAIRLNEEALAINRRLYGDAHPRVGDNWESLGEVRQMENRFTDAIADYSKADRIFQAWYGKGNPKTVENLVCLGQAEMWAGNLEAARRHLRDGIEAGERSAGPNAADMLLAYNIMGTLEQKANRFEAAKLWFQRLIEGAQTTYGKGSYVRAIGLANLATLERVTGRYAVAAAEYREVLSSLRALGLESRLEFAKTELNLGKTLISESLFAEAKPVLGSALKLFRSLPEPSQGDVHDAQANLQLVTTTLKPH